MHYVSILADAVDADRNFMPRHGCVLLLERTGHEFGEETDLFPTDASFQ